jgi:hypothetical protein
MSWKPSEDADQEVRQWMKSKGWEVSGAEYDFEREIYAWKARSVRSGHSPVLRISRQVLTDLRAFAVLEHLHRLEVAAAIRSRPGARYVVVQNGPQVTLEEATSS